MTDQPADHSADLVTDRATHAVPHTRGHLSHVLRSWRIPTPLVDDAALLVSELATNAVHHGTGSTLRIHTQQRDHVLHCQVHDDGPGPASPPSPPPRPPSTERPSTPSTGCPASGQANPDPLPETGRGLALVDALATRWGSYTDPTLPTGQHVVWFDIACPETDPESNPQTGFIPVVKHEYRPL